MWRYGMHARDDAAAIFKSVVEFAKAEGRTVHDVRQWYEAIDPKVVYSFEETHFDDIASYLAKSESQRPATLRRLGKNLKFHEVLLFQLLAMLGALRAADLVNVRDRHVDSLMPGGSYRVTTAGLYRCADDILLLRGHEWPSDFLAEIGYFLDDGEDDD